MLLGPAPIPPRPCQAHANIVRAVKEWGIKETFWKIFQQRTLKFGDLVGTDKYGNKYYENKKDYPFGTSPSPCACLRLPPSPYCLNHNILVPSVFL